MGDGQRRRGDSIRGKKALVNAIINLISTKMKLEWLYITETYKVCTKIYLSYKVAQ